MAETDGMKLAAGIRFMHELHSNVARMLRASDAIMQDFGLSRYDWNSVNEGLSSCRLDSPNRWMPHRMVRGFYRPERKDQELVSVGVMLWNPDRPIDEPLAIASYVRYGAKTHTTNAPYHLGLWQVHFPGVGADGVVRSLVAPEDWGEFRRHITDGMLLTVARPLADITDSIALIQQLIRPLLDELEKSSAGQSLSMG